MRQKVLETILVLMIALGVFFWLSGNKHYLLAAGILGVVALVFPSIAQGIHWAWMKLGQGMGYVTSRVILTVVYFLLLVPLSLLSRLFGRKPLKMKAGGATYYKERNFTYTKESMKNVW